VHGQALARFGFLLFAFATIVLCGATFAGRQAQAQTCPDNLISGGIAWSGRTVLLVASPGIQGGNLYYFWQTTGSSAWNKQHVASGGCPGPGFQPLTTLGYRSNAIVWTGKSVIIAAVDQRNGGLYYWWQAAGTTPWNKQTIANGPPGCCNFGSVDNGVTTPHVMGYSPPSMAWTGRSVVVAATYKNGLNYWFQESGQSTWYHQLVNANTVGDQPAIAWTGSSVVIADICNNGALCYYWQQAGSNVWHQQIVDKGPDQFPSIAWNGHAVVIAATHYATANAYPGTVTYWWQAAGTAPWHAQTVSAPRSVPYDDLDYWGPTVAAAGNSIVIAAADVSTSAQQVDYWWSPAFDNGTWNLQNLNASGTYGGATGPRAIAWTGVSVILTASDDCGDVDYWWQRAGTAPWNHQRVYTNPSPPGPGGC
jgi:hypothetical protein